MSGPAAGVELSSGQVTVMSEGAAAVPSETRITEMSAGALILRVSSSVPVNSCSQRSDPAGEGTSDSEPETEVAVSCCASASNPISLCAASPTHASTSEVRP
ncbi:MAG: hypothetical protein J0G30_12260 [Actinomycetales bacterium]|nr:hypothetical protein [Actinomycetales bacterium]